MDVKKYTWIGLKMNNIERASIRLLDEDWVQEFAAESMDDSIFFFANVGEETNEQPAQTPEQQRGT